ncbi:MAG: gliding motility-associated C-terminal domain-containing protein [Bacteroidia bacterium]
MRIKFKNNTQHAHTYRWVFGDGSPDSYEAEPVHYFKFAGQWDVTLIATGSGGTTTETKQYMINVFPKPVADFYTNKKFMNLPNAVFAMQNVSSNAVKFNWVVTDSLNNEISGSTLRDPSFLIDAVGRYTVQLVAFNSYGCSDTALKTNYLSTFQEGFVYTPTAFSPNKNGRNDGFKPSTYNVKDNNYVFRVFNRWGQKVFESTDQNEEWDGTHNGIQCEQDVYVWSVNGEYTNNDLFAFRGTVTLQR